jgi:hypothetical protein
MYFYPLVHIVKSSHFIAAAWAEDSPERDGRVEQFILTALEET